LGWYRHAGHEALWELGIKNEELGIGRGEDRIQNSEFRIQKGKGGGRWEETGWILDGGFLEKVWRELRSGWREGWEGKVALLADHHVGTYLEIFRAGGDAVPEEEGGERWGASSPPALSSTRMWRRGSEREK
jgi:hypothetical protein